MPLMMFMFGSLPFVVLSSVMKYATVIISVVGSPPHWWGALLSEGSLSLNPLWNHWMIHQNCSNQMRVINGDLFIFLILVFPCGPC